MRIINDLLHAMGLGRWVKPDAKPHDIGKPQDTGKPPRAAPDDDVFFRVGQSPAGRPGANLNPTRAEQEAAVWNSISIPAAHANVPAVQLASGMGSVMDLVNYFDIDEERVATSTNQLVLAGKTNPDDLFVLTLASLCNQLGNPQIDRSELLGKQGLQGISATNWGPTSSKRVLDTLSRLGIIITLDGDKVTVTREAIDKTKIKPVEGNDLAAIYNSIRPANTEFVYVNGHWYAVEK